MLLHLVRGVVSGRAGARARALGGVLHIVVAPKQRMRDAAEEAALLLQMEQSYIN